MILSPFQVDAVIHEFATLCLSSLSVDFVCKAEIFNKEGLPPLIKLLSSSDPDVQKNSLETIYNLVEVTEDHSLSLKPFHFRCIYKNVFNTSMCPLLASVVRRITQVVKQYVSWPGSLLFWIC